MIADRSGFQIVPRATFRRFWTTAMGSLSSPSSVWPGTIFGPVCARSDFATVLSLHLPSPMTRSRFSVSTTVVVTTRRSLVALDTDSLLWPGEP